MDRVIPSGEYEAASKSLTMVDAKDFSSTTGRMTWNAALVMKEYLKRIGVVDKVILDVSSGNGFLAMALSLLGAKKVYATECPKCFNLLGANFTENFEKNKAIKGSYNKPDAIEYSWGDSKEAIDLAVPVVDIVVFSDLLYITFRDDIVDIFKSTMLDLITDGREGIFCYESRLTEREQNFIDEFLYAEFDVIELDCTALGLLDACRESEQGEIEESDFSLFYQPPPLRLLLLTKKR